MSREVVVASVLRQPAPPLSPPDRPETHAQPEHRNQPKESVAPSESAQPTENVQGKDNDPRQDCDPPEARDQTEDLVEGLRRVVRDMVAKQEVSASAA
jgi:hypothetical protein